MPSKFILAAASSYFGHALFEQNRLLRKRKDYMKYATWPKMETWYGHTDLARGTSYDKRWWGYIWVCAHARLHQQDVFYPCSVCRRSTLNVGYHKLEVSILKDLLESYPSIFHKKLTIQLHLWIFMDKWWGHHTSASYLLLP